MEDVSEHVVGDIGHADLYPGPADANGPDEELHFVLLPREHMLDRGPDLGSSPIGLGHRLWHRPPLRLALVDVRLQAVLGQPFLVRL